MLTRRSEWELRADIVEVCHRMHARGYVSAMDGNVSARMTATRLLATPAGAAKGFMKPEDLVVVDLDGNPVKGDRRPSSELKLHLAAYRVRPEVAAVVHAHPPAAVAHSIAGISLAPCIIPETVLTLGSVASAGYAAPGTQELATSVEKLLKCYDAVMMDRHGSVTLGSDVYQAYYRLEALEHTARTTLMARMLGPVRPLPTLEVERLYRIAEESGIQWNFRTCGECNVCEPRTGSDDQRKQVEDLVARVVEQVLKKI